MSLNRPPVLLVPLLNCPNGLLVVLELVDENAANPPLAPENAFEVIVLVVVEVAGVAAVVVDSPPILKLFTPNVDLPNDEPKEVEPNGAAAGAVVFAVVVAAGLPVVFASGFGKAEAKLPNPKELVCFASVVDFVLLLLLAFMNGD